MTWGLALVAALLLTTLAGCADDSEPREARPAAGEVPPPLSVAHCRAEAYRLLDGDGLGQPVDHERMEGWGLESTALDALITLAGFEELTPVSHGVELHRYRFTTQDRGQAIEATGMLAFPAHLDDEPSEPWPVALLLHGFAGAWDACAPSADALIGPAQPALLAAQGFVVVAPDFIGMNGMGAASTAPHAPLVGEQVALGAWDALRSGLALLEGDLKESLVGELRSDVVIWGASQGGHAAFFAELAAPYVAPEVEVTAVVASSPAFDLKAVVSNALDDYAAPTGLTALALVGMWRWYGVPDDLLGLLTNEEPYHFADQVRELLEGGVGDECEVDVDVDVDATEAIFAPEFLTAVRAGDWDALQPWSCFLDENSVATNSVERLRDTPLLVVHGELDPLVIPRHQRAGYRTLCDRGWLLEHLQCLGAPHGETTLWSLDEQVDWLRARLDGAPAPPGCTWAEPTCCSASPSDVCTP